MASHGIAPIPTLERYFDRPGITPVIVQEYTHGIGWVRTGYRKRVSRAWLRKLRAAGVTQVALQTPRGGIADFTILELLAEG